MKSVLALVPAAFVAGTLINAPAEASCGHHGGCGEQHGQAKSKEPKGKAGRPAAGHANPAKSAQAKTARSARAKSARSAQAKRAKSAHSRTAKRVHARFAVAEPVRNPGVNPASIREDRAAIAAPQSKDWDGREAVTLHDIARLRALDDLATRHVALTASVSGFEAPDADTGHAVVEMIETMSPGYAVPTWFALRIAKIESNYNPRVRGSDGEYGIYQIKCETARMLGFSGDCAQLFDMQTNIEWGLKHLSEALKSSNGDLELAASKHNAGLGRQTLVRRYVDLVF